jgi:Holliday junction DNA helicase RuvB
MAILAERPVHLLLCGPPASAKLLFMRSLTRLDRRYYTVGSSCTKSGIFDYLFEYRRRYFIIDELEKLNKKDQASLLNLMESGILTGLKHKQQRATQLKHGYLLHVIVQISYYHHYFLDLETFISNHIQKKNLCIL